MSKKKENIGIYLTEIVKKYGENVLQDINRVNALLMDLAPDNDKERKLIVMCLREGILAQLYIAKQNPMPEIVINRCVKQLISDIWITESAAKYAVEIIAKVIGIDCLCEMQMTPKNSTDTAILLKGEKKVVDDLELEKVLDNVEVIGYKAFAFNNQITRVRIPKSLKKIMAKAFVNCHNLSHIVLESNIDAISSSAFDGCNNIREIESYSTQYVCTNGILINKEERKTIKAENRDNANLVVIPNGIQIITNKTFEGNSASTVQIPETVSKIEKRAFEGMNNLQSILVESYNKNYCSLDGVLHDQKGEELIKYPMSRKESSYYIEDSVKRIGRLCFSYARNLKMITLTGALQKIDYAAFQFCSNLESLILPYGVGVIGEKAFQYCTKLKSVMLSRKIVEIEDCAFYQCTSLESVSVPESVERIGNYAFWGCKSLRIVTIQNEVEEIGYGAFEGCDRVCIKIRNNSYAEKYCRAHNINYEML